MKKEVLMLIAVVLSLNFAYASCDDSQTILRLYNSENSHASLWSDSSYDYRICFNDIFGESFSGTSHPSCASNAMLWLNSQNNSHASINQIPGYNIPVCFGDLVCFSDDSAGDDCANPEAKVIARLQQENNSHVSNSSSDYPIKICCFSGLGAVSDLHWENMLQIPISSARTGASVKAVVPGSNLEGRSISYEIWKDRKWWWDEKLASSDVKGDLIWKAGKNKSGIFETGNYYFKAKPQGSSTFIMSSGLFGTLAVSAGENIPPVANITSPKNRQVYFLGELLNFSQSSYDIDSSFTYVWDFGDSLTASGDSLSGNNYETTHSYSSPGQKNIKLTVTDDEGAVSTDRISILIVNSSYILSYIDEPKWGVFFTNNWTKFNASGAYSVNITHNSSGIEKIECLAGFCPQNTEGCPPPAVNYPACQIPILNSPNNAGFSDINFYWEFDNSPSKNFSGNGNSGSNFYRSFMPGIHTARLTASLFSAESSVETSWNNLFTFTDPNPYCWNDASSGASYWVYLSGSYVSSFNECFKESVAAGSRNTCCDSGYKCNTGTGKCVSSLVSDCGDYKTESECNEDNSSVGGISVEARLNRIGYCSGFTLSSWDSNNVHCENITGNCRCSWNNGNCTSRYSVSTLCTNNQRTALGECRFSMAETTNCSAGFKLIKWTGEWVQETAGVKPEGAICENGQKRIPCPAQLSFASISGMIIAIILIIVFYLLVSRKKDKKIKDKAKGKKRKEKEF